MRKRKIYRFEQVNGNGCWYNSDQSFNNLYGKVVDNIPMPRDTRPTNYRAGCFSKADLFTWGSLEALKKMGAVLVVVLSTDYKLLPKGEVIYNEQTTIYRKVLKQF